MKSTICLLGPTCSGKTLLSFSSIIGFGAQIINMDVGLMYKEMNKGTAKPQNIENYSLIDIISPTEVLTSFGFTRRTKELIVKSNSCNQFLMISGGSFFYYKALTDCFLQSNISNRSYQAAWPPHYKSSFWVNRRSYYQLNQCYLTLGLLRMLLRFGTGTFIRQSIINRRIIPLVLVPSDPDVIKRRIATRIQLMLSNGLIEETINLKQKYNLSSNSISMKLIGYKQALDYINGLKSHNEMQFEIMTSSFKLLKSQLTWIKAIRRHATIDCCLNSLKLLSSFEQKLKQFSCHY